MCIHLILINKCISSNIIIEFSHTIHILNIYRKKRYSKAFTVSTIGLT